MVDAVTVMCACVQSYLLIEGIVCHVVHPIMGLFRYEHTLPLPQLVIVRSVGLEESGE